MKLTTLQEGGFIGSPGDEDGFSVANAVLAALSLGAAAIHFAVVASHWAEFPPFGAAFAALAWFQALWGALALRGVDRRATWLAVAVNGGAVAV